MAATNGDDLPPYNTLFREEEPPAPTETNTNIRRRYTTITLREIYYPSGCPCHPPEQPDKKGKRKQHDHPPNHFRIDDALDGPMWLGHARPTLAERTPSQSSAVSSSNSSTTSSKTRPWNWFHRRTSS
ncbi:hypothetical protein LTR10_021786 [Elasticomyces elasticus]|uniref:Uncharacterized protein n=1 Tax=Exophiala sideris TaxID=1016849 RepID=A0ABR0J6B9_9EURO|nr:hypothetical protein LTR10_021786 [Elasticomyces elasticus]KAK5028724.1 hypothetical protein LTS07_006103 [Exophiala sideris]KAK5035592.1 hypothetical protein LTR13_005721 [Exophiala sideris]KAK5057228.1 hypothetical protein LTR69_007267 [Exophiala sideris]KAK5181799.1 hypothetical protein LTR44_005999 [Eurotiomycetes sp. CCFEE 6388]